MTDATKGEVAALLQSMSDGEKDKLVAALKQTLRSVYYGWRVNAAYVIGLLGPAARDLISPLIDGMNCWKCRVAMEVVAALPKISSQDAVSELIKSLRKAPSPDADSYSWTDHDENLVMCLASLGPVASDAAPHLAAYLHFSPGCSEALVSIGSASVSQVIAEVKRATRPRRARICTRAASVLSAIGADAAKPLLNALESSSGEQQLAMAMLFAELKPPALSTAATPVLRRLLSNASLKEYAQKALDAMESDAEFQKSGDGNRVSNALHMVHSYTPMWQRKQTELASISAMSDSERRTLIDELIAILQNGRHSERANTAYALGVLGAAAHPAVPALIESLKYMNAVSVMQVASALTKMDAEYVLPLLVEALPLPPSPAQSSYTFSRHEARIIECIEAFGMRAESFAPKLARFVRSDSASTMIANLGLAAVPAVLKVVEESNKQHAMSWVCRNAAEVLSSIGAEANKLLVDALESSNAEMLEAISLVFSSLKRPALSVDAAPSLCRMLTSNSQNVQRNAKQALLSMGVDSAPVACEYLDERMPTFREDRSFQVELVLQSLLREYGADAVPALAARVQQVDRKKQAGLAGDILRLDPNNSEAADKLVALLGDDDDDVRLAAAKAVRHCHGNSSAPVPKVVEETLMPAVAYLWQDRNPAVRRAATDALERFWCKVPLYQNYVVAVEQPAMDEGRMPGDDLIIDTLQRRYSKTVVKGHMPRTEKGADGPMYFVEARLVQPDFLRKSAFVEITVQGGPFDWIGRCLYSFDGEELKEMDGDRRNGGISQVLSSERIELDQVHPVSLATMFVELFMPTRRAGFGVNMHGLVQAAPAYEGKSPVKPPHVTASGDGWILHFWTIHFGGGCTPTIPTLHEHTVKISRKYDVDFRLAE
jgi:flagellar motor switch protein FliG